jgi:hypothetical protein
VEESVACAPQDEDASGISICATAYALAKGLDPHDDVPHEQDVVLRRYFLHLLATHGDVGENQGNDGDAPANDLDKDPITAAQKRQLDGLLKKVFKRPKYQ